MRQAGSLSYIGFSAENLSAKRCGIILGGAATRPNAERPRPSRLLEKPRGKPAQIFDFNLCSFEEILGSVLYKNDPTKRGNREKGCPERQTKVEHLAILRVSGFNRKKPGEHVSAYRRMGVSASFREVRSWEEEKRNALGT